MGSFVPRGLKLFGLGMFAFAFFSFGTAQAYEGVFASYRTNTSSVPERATMVLLGTGLLGIGAKLRKDRSNARKRSEMSGS